MSASQHFIGWAWGPEMTALPGQVEAKVCTQMLDGIGVAIAAARGGEGEAGRRVAEQLGGASEAQVIGSGLKIAAPAAALGSGVLVHALDYDDTHPLGLVHATSVVLPACLSVGQLHGRTGAEVVSAAAVAYELMCRLGSASPHGFHGRGLHATAVCGPLAAALAASRLGGLSCEVAADALGIAGSSSGGLLEFLDTGSATKQLHPGMAAMSGLLAARFAAAGADGPPSILEGRRGVYATLSDRPLELDVITHGLGRDWQLSDIATKLYPACQLMHPTLDAATQLLASRGFALEDVVSIDVPLHPDALPVIAEPRAGKLAPRSTYEAKFSVQWSLAALLIDRALTLATYQRDSLSRVEVGALAARIHTNARPQSVAAAAAVGQLTMTLSDGTQLSAATDSVPAEIASQARRSAGEQKFLDNVGGPSDAASELAARMTDLTQEPSLARILELAAVLASRDKA